MNRTNGELLGDRDDVEDLPDYTGQEEELTEDELDDVSGGEDGWGTGTPPPPSDGG